MSQEQADTNRFDGLDEAYSKGGHPREASDEVTDGINTVRDFFSEVAPWGDTPKTTDLAREMRAVKEAKDAADAVAKELGRRWDFMRLILMPARFEEEGLQNVKVEGVGRVNLRADIYARMNPSRKDDAMEWLDDNGRGDLVQRTVNASSLKAILKQMLEAGEEIPEELFSVTPFTMATLTKG